MDSRFISRKRLSSAAIVQSRIQKIHSTRTLTAHYQAAIRLLLLLLPVYLHLPAIAQDRDPPTGESLAKALIPILSPQAKTRFEHAAAHKVIHLSKNSHNDREQ